MHMRILVSYQVQGVMYAWHVPWFLQPFRSKSTSKVTGTSHLVALRRPVQNLGAMFASAALAM